MVILWVAAVAVERRRGGGEDERTASNGWDLPDLEWNLWSWLLSNGTELLTYIQCPSCEEI